MIVRIVVRVGAVLLALAAAAPAGAREWQVDAASSKAAFEVPVLRYFTSRGRFPELSGTLSWDPESRELRVSARMMTATLTMSSDTQARWAKSKDFFDVEKYPEIVFESDPMVVDALAEGMTIAGRLTLHGQTNPVQLELGPSECILALDAPCTLRAGTSVARAPFGLSHYKALVGDDVKLSLDVVARPLP
jgi:polyisoprenoid-binding protein YceI